MGCNLNSGRGPSSSRPPPRIRMLADTEILTPDELRRYILRIRTAGKLFKARNDLGESPKEHGD